MVEVWTRKREMRDEDESDMGDTSSYEKFGVQQPWLGLEDLVWVLLPAILYLVPAVSGMVN